MAFVINRGKIDLIKGVQGLRENENTIGNLHIVSRQ